MASTRELQWSIKAMGASAALKDIQGLDKGVDKLKGTMGSADKGIDKLSAKFTKFGNGAKKTSKSLAKISAPAAAISGLAIKMAMDVDTAQRKVSTLWDSSAKSLGQMKKDIREISDKSGFSQTDVADGMYEALSSGVDTPDVSAFTMSNINLAKAGFTDLSTAIDATTTVLNAYGDSAFEVDKIHDIFVKTQDKGKITVDELAKSIGRVIPIASSAGVNIDELGASYSILTAKGQNAMIATTNLNSMFEELSKSGTGVDKTLKKITKKGFKDLVKEGKSTGDVLKILDDEARKSGQTLSDMFGSSTAGAAALTLLSGGVEEYNAAVSEMQNADGATQANVDKLRGDAEKLKEALNKAKNSLIDLGASAAPYIEKVADGITALSDKFNALDDGTKDKIMKIMLITAVAAPLLGIIGSIAQGLGAIGTAFGGVKLGLSGLIGLGPMGIIVFGALIGIGVALYKNWDAVKEKANQLKEAASNAANRMSESFAAAKETVTSALEAIRAKWESVKEFLRHPIKGVISIVSNIASGISDKITGGGDASGGGARGHATGLNRVPYDEYPARLHRGEIVLPKKVADSYREQGGNIHGLPSSSLSGGNTQNFNPTINITVNGGDENIAQQVAQATRNELDKMFNQLRLQRV